MRKILISGLVIIALGVAGCGAAPTSAPTKAGATIEQPAWEEIEGVFTGHMGHQEVLERIDKTKFNHELKEDLRAIAYQLIYVQEMVDSKKIREEAQTMWEMRAESPDTWIYDYDMMKTKEHDNRFIEE